jgi:hypothetical protein
MSDTENLNEAADSGLLQTRLVRLEAELAKEHADNAKLKQEWQKYRLALNRIAHPETYGIRTGHEVNIALRALVIGMEVDPLPRGAKITEPNADVLAPAG